MTGSTEILDVIRAYRGDVELGAGLAERLAKLGAGGAIALALYHAQRHSDTAKTMRRGYFKGREYAQKNEAMRELCQVLQACGAVNGIGDWGWSVDPKQPRHNHVLYLELPTGQVSFHAGERGPGPDYAKGWDGRPGQSVDRIVRWVARLLEGRA